MTRQPDGDGGLIGWLAGEAGVERFVDAGSGLPTAQNTHQVAQARNRAASVVYIDRDPSVAAHGRALLLDNDRTYFAAADLTRPDDVLADARDVIYGGVARKA